MNLELTGLTALVTGASRGIGFAVAQAFAREGCHLHMAARTAADLDAARTKILAESKVNLSGTLLTVDGGRAVRHAT